jgi:hypothetical protein
MCKSFEKCLNTSKKSHAHLQYVHNNCARLELVWEELISIHKVAVYSKHVGKMTVELHVNYSKNVRTLPKSHMHIFNVSITTVQGLKNVS